jgi:hypothetical protein
VSYLQCLFFPMGDNSDKIIKIVWIEPKLIVSTFGNAEKTFQRMTEN